MSRELNLGLTVLRGKNLGEIFTTVTLYDERKEVSEILSDAVYILSLNSLPNNVSKVTIKKVVDEFINMYEKNTTLFNSMLSKEYYSGSIEKAYEKLCKNLLVISILETGTFKNFEDNSLNKAEACAKSKFIELFYGLKYLTSIDCGLEEIGTIASKYADNDKLETSLENYLNTKVKNFNLKGLHYIMKHEFKTLIINQILNESIIVKEKYATGSLTTISSIHTALEVIAEAYGSILAKVKIVKTLNSRKERVSDKIDYCVQPLGDLDNCYLEEGKEYFNELHEIFTTKENYNEW